MNTVNEFIAKSFTNLINTTECHYVLILGNKDGNEHER